MTNEQFAIAVEALTDKISMLEFQLEQTEKKNSEKDEVINKLFKDIADLKQRNDALAEELQKKEDDF